MTVDGAEISPAQPWRSSRAGARNLNGQASQFAIRTVPFSNVGRPAQGPATFNDLATRLPTAARTRLNRSERTNRSLLPTHSGAQNTQFRAASIAIGIVLMAAHNGGYLRVRYRKSSRALRAGLSRRAHGHQSQRCLWRRMWAAGSVCRRQFCHHRRERQAAGLACDADATATLCQRAG
jgi:hypothetical protein